MEASVEPMAGKICLVTGATSGIGAVTARELARLGASVILVGRNRDRCAATADAIGRETGRGSPEVPCADLSSLADVRRLAPEFVGRYDPGPVLSNNAAGMLPCRRAS